MSLPKQLPIHKFMFLTCFTNPLLIPFRVAIIALSDLDTCLSGAGMRGLLVLLPLR